MNRFKRDAITIFESALAAANAGNAVRRKFRIPAGHFDRIFLISAGKAACEMASAVHEKIGEHLNGAIVITKEGHADVRVPGCWLWEAGHPIPDERGVRASEAVRELASQLTGRDLLIVCLSGGASALLSAPAPPVTLKDKQLTTGLLLRAGADIHELNAVRKHVSFLKGGRLAALAYPAKILTLTLSDVIGDPVDVIASGPTAPDATTCADAIAVLTKYDLIHAVPPSVLERLKAEDETPKAGDAVFRNVENVIVGSNRLALEAAAATARDMGYETTILSDRVQGEARDAGLDHARILKRADPPACILSGGETTVTVRGKGKGGRNQEFALAAAIEIDGDDDRAVLCAGTDGTDGPTDAAGAFAAGDTLKRAAQLGLDAGICLRENNSYAFFGALGDLIKTGPTGTNVMDINVMLARRS
ncbi:MAG: glycerate kinase [Acidobacteriaceae bacterium]|nr:glycerate kinase [Acidobacteriaceae bacterium]